MSKRYFSDRDPIVGVTPSKLKRMGQESQQEYMRHWFHENYENPDIVISNEGDDYTDVPDEEYEYLYAFGGPYDAEDEFTKEFGDIVLANRIKEMAEEVELNGVTEWAPGSKHPERAKNVPIVNSPNVDLDNLAKAIKGRSIQFGSKWELEEREKILALANSLQAALKGELEIYAGLGHNKPPTKKLLQLRQKVERVEQAGIIVRLELVKSTPDLPKVITAAKVLKAAAKWLLAKADNAINSACVAAGSAVGVAGGAALINGWEKVAARADAVGDALIHWLVYITG